MIAGVMHRQLGRAAAVAQPLQSFRATPKLRQAAMGVTSMAKKEDVVADAVAWAHLNGLIMGQGDGVDDVSVIHAPFSLLPTPFPRSEFELVQRSMPLFSSLVHTISQDSQYLATTLRAAAQYDDFTGSLLAIFQETAEAREKLGSRVSLGLHRSDYMLDEPSTSLLQVELNTIAASFGSLSTQVSALHRHLLTLHPSHMPCEASQLPEQDALGGFARAIADAHGANIANSELPEDAVVVMVVQPGERNAYDQQWLQQTLWRDHKVRVWRKSLHDIATRGETDDRGVMRIDGAAVSVFYLRAGYTPDDYPSASEWDARRKMESCCAASCPSVAYQLVGAKKIQQDLASPVADSAVAADRLRQFVDSDTDVDTLQACFAGLWSLEDAHAPETQEVVASAIKAPEQFVLKPQREGGGNNLYGEELVEKLKGGGADLASFTLMQRIRPPVHQSTLVRNGKAVADTTLSELGIYGTYVRIGNEVRINECVGHLLRTKTSSSDEGGVAAGFAVLDSPYLTD